MDKKAPTAATIDAYVAGFPTAMQEKLLAIRNTIHKAVPEAEERISYQMPAFFYKGILIYFAAFKDHISIFPTADGVEAFKDELLAYKGSKGTVQLPLDQPLPLALIARIAQYRAAANARVDDEKRRQAEVAAASGETTGRRKRKP